MHRPRHIVTLCAVLACTALLTSCNRDTDPGPWSASPGAVVLVSPDAPEAVVTTAGDVAASLEQMGLSARVETATEVPACRDGRGVAVLHGDGLGDAADPASISDHATDQTFAYREERCGERGWVVHLRGGGLLGRQYAAYEWLHELGVRYFHPEEEFHPESPWWPDAPLDRAHTPAFTWRSVSLHLTHPLELGDPIRGGREDLHEEAVRYIDWNVKNMASYARSGIGDGQWRTWGLDRGLPLDTGFSLHNQQQGGQAILDPDDPRTEEEQLADAIDQRMTAHGDRTPDFFNFTFNPSEFTELDDRDIVRQISFITNHITENYPGTQVMCTNHGTAGPPTEHYGVRFYDLPQFAPPELGVRVHTLMFYDLFRPAPVYGNENFRYLYDFMVENYQTRTIWHYPESAWWLTFDIPVPLYLPITLEARDRDIQAISFMLDGNLNGHRVFGSGHEWGYWQNEYCSFRMAVDLDYRWTDCVRDIAVTAGPTAAPVVDRALRDVVDWQERDIIYGDLLRWVVGSDPETELGDTVGIVFHPLPPAPAEIMNWREAEVQDFLHRVDPALARMAADYTATVERLRAVRSTVPARGLPFFDEILDGIEVTGLRAAHAQQLWGAAVLARKARLTGSDTHREAAEERYARALDITETVREIVHRREEGYRYQPLERSIAGGPDGTEDSNWTTYSYRYLNRTHHLYYYERPNRLVGDAMRGGDNLVEVDDAFLSPGQPAVVTVTRTDLEDFRIQFAEGATSSRSPAEHTYTTPGAREIVVSGTLEGEPVEERLRVAQLSDRLRTGFTGTIVDPSGTEIIEDAIPALQVGRTTANRLAVGWQIDRSDTIRPDQWRTLDLTFDGEIGRTAPRNLEIPVVDNRRGEVQASLQVADAIFTVRGVGAPILLEGRLSTEAVVEAIVEFTNGAFDTRGARRLVASLLGYTPDTLPPEVAFLASFDASEGEGWPLVENGSDAAPEPSAPPTE